MTEQSEVNCVQMTDLYLTLSLSSIILSKERPMSLTDWQVYKLAKRNSVMMIRVEILNNKFDNKTDY